MQAGKLQGLVRRQTAEIRKYHLTSVPLSADRNKQGRNVLLQECYICILYPAALLHKEAAQGRIGYLWSKEADNFSQRIRRKVPAGFLFLLLNNVDSPAAFVVVWFAAFLGQYLL